MVLLGQVHLKLGEVEKAKRVLTRALDEDPDLGETHYQLARAFLDATPPDAAAARKHGDEAVKLGFEVPEQFLRRLKVMEGEKGSKRE